MIKAQHYSLSPLPHYTTQLFAKIQIVNGTFRKHFIQALTINKSGTSTSTSQMPRHIWEQQEHCRIKKT
jgi:hypothetical protein